MAYSPDHIPIAYYGVIPCLIQYKDHLILSAQSGDTMTHPGFRLKGLFVELSAITFELCRTSGIKFIFGFPNQNSYHGAIKLGWQMTDTMDRFSIPIASFPLQSLSDRFPWTRPLYAQYVKWILRKYSQASAGLPNALLSEGFGGIYRDDRYLQYKTYSPTRVLRIGEALAWVKIRGGLTLGDLHVGDQHFETTMQGLQKIARYLGVKNISFQASPGTRIHGLFAAKYEPIPSFPILFQDFGSGIPLQEIKFTFCDIDIF